MSSSMTFEFKDLDKFKVRLNAIGEAAAEVMGKAALAGAQLAEGYIKDNIRDQKLIDTSNLVQKVHAKLDSAEGKIAEASVGPRGVAYARIHEYGGIIKAKNAPYLHFMTKDGAWHKVKSVHIPARPYMRPAFDEHRQDINDVMARVLEQKINEAATK